MVSSVRNEEGVTATVEGINKLKAAMTGLPDKLRKKVLLSALRKGAALVRKAARDATPVLQQTIPYRTKGLLKKRLMVRVSRESKSQGNVGVFVNIKPLPKSSRSTFNPQDPYYWRFVAFPTKAHEIKARRVKFLYFNGNFAKSVLHPGWKGENFLQAGADVLPKALEVFEREVIPAIEKFNHP